MDKFPKKGLLLVMSGPSGAGKGTICKELVKDENIKYSISATTRAPRGSEENGKDYFFLSTEEFEQRINTDGFLEWAKVLRQILRYAAGFCRRGHRRWQGLYLRNRCPGCAENPRLFSRGGAHLYFAAVLERALPQIERSRDGERGADPNPHELGFG